LVEDIKDDVAIVRGDLGNWSDIFTALRSNEIDCVYHLGALLGDACEASPEGAYNINIGGTLRVLEASRLLGLRAVLFPSSLGTFGRGVPEVIPPEAFQRPTTMYGVTKVVGERFGEWYNQKFGLNFRALRLPNLIGPGRAGGLGEAFSLIIQEPASGRPYTVVLDEEAQVTLMYVKDAARAFVELHDAAESSLTKRAYNLHGFSPTAREIAETTRRVVPGAEIDFQPVEELARIMHTQPKEMDDSDARREWGWQPRYTLEEAVSDFVAEVRAHPGRYDR
jgi:nucleoside-diphosphate-sugar epimerase